MAVVDTNQSFSTGDTVTSTSLNNIMDQSIFVPGAIVNGDGLLVTAGGQMTLATITSGKIGSGEVKTINIADGDVTQAKLAAGVVGNGPAFRATTTGNNVPNNAFTLVTLSDTASNTFDTNSNFASNTFTPTVAGYYQVNGGISFTAVSDGALVAIYKNGVLYSYGSPAVSNGVRSTVSDVVYLNGTGDYVNLYALQTSGTQKTLASGQGHFSGCLVRSA
jgi:hypothetical protein